jgi:alanine racemase
MKINSLLPCATDLETPPDARAWIEVDLGAIRANMAQLHALPGLRNSAVMAVLKADAYGHGLVPVAQTAVEAGAAWLGVAAVAEGVELRQAGLQEPILLLCALAPGEATTLLRHGLVASVGDAATRDSLAAAARALGLQAAPAVHLEIDTGIGRAGVLPEEAVPFWRETVAAGLRVTGLMTHLSDADGDAELTLAQQSAFQAVRCALEEAGAQFEHVHLNNSAGALRPGAIGSTMFRPGMLLYGIQPSLPGHTPLTLLPAMSVKARVGAVRSLPTGHPISYGATHRLTRPSRVATVLLGYGDGYPRRLSNCGSVLLHGRRAPILGRVCMDQTVVDVTDLPGVEPGEVAVCLGAQGAERITVEEIAALLATTEHEITTCLTARLPRVFL